jgi:hypothetical protein
MWCLSKDSALFCLDIMKGNPILPIIFNALGARIGSRAHLDTLAITEPDLCKIQNDCSISASAVLFGHSLDRGLFSQAPLTIGRGSSIDNHALLLLGTGLRNFTHLEHSSATFIKTTDRRSLGPLIKWDSPLASTKCFVRHPDSAPLPLLPVPRLALFIELQRK